MSEPTVSIIIAAYQAEGTIERSVMSALEQTAEGVEVIVVDDGSADRTRSIVANLIARMGGERLVLAPATPNEGPSAARNRGLAMVRGEWVGFLDADDEYMPNFVERMLSAAHVEPMADVVACAHRIVQIDGGHRTRSQVSSGVDLSGQEAAIRALEYDLTHYVWDKLFRRDVLGLDPFPPRVHRGEDLVAVLKAFMAAHTVRTVDDALVDYYVSASSLTWGRVAPIEESASLARAIRGAVGPLSASRTQREAVQLSESLIYLNAAHQGITRLPRQEAIDFCRRSGAQIPWGVVARTLRSRRVDGAAQLLLKAVPSLYRRAYQLYTRYAYSIAD